MMVKFTYCKNFAHAETKEVEWDDFTKATTKSVGYDTKEQSIKRAAIVGGIRADESVGRAENIASRTIASLDYDDLPEGTTLDDIELALSLGLDCAFTAYTTFRHTPEAPRFRVFIPLSRAVTPKEYPNVVGRIREVIGLDGLDDCSYTVNQIMFLASHKNGIEPWSLIEKEKMPFDVGEVPAAEVSGGIVTASAVEDDDDFFVPFIPPTLDEAREVLNYVDPNCDYDQWRSVLMVLHACGDEFFDLAKEWSERSKKSVENTGANSIKRKWASFNRNKRTGLTWASVCAMAKKGGADLSAIAKKHSTEVSTDVALSLEAEAEQVADRETYSAFKKRVQCLNEMQLPLDFRATLAKTVHEVYGKSVGMTINDVRSAFKPPKRNTSVSSDEISADAPEWLTDWCYHSADNLFINITLPALAINKEGFNAKFAHKDEPKSLEMRPSDYAINYVHIPTVDRLFFMPDTSDIICERNGFSALNTYRKGGVTPCEVLDADGQAVVDLFLAHIAWLFPNKEERTILLDWMAHIYQNQGQRVNWAMVIWGIQGSGKTLIFNVLQRLIGVENTKDISPNSLRGDFNDWAVGGIVGCIEEIRISGQSKWAVMDIMKPAITNDLLAINPKGRTSYSGAPNFCSYMMLTNHQDAIPVNDEDRRFCVLFSQHTDAADMEADHGGREGLSKYFSRLFDGCVHRRPDAMARFFADYKISAGFDHKGRAPRTSGFAQMAEANVSDEQGMILSLIDDGVSPLITREIICVTELRAMALDKVDGELPYGRALGVLLREMGYQPVGPRCFKVGPHKHYVWTKGRAMDDDRAKKLVQDFYASGSDFVDVPF